MASEEQKEVEQSVGPEEFLRPSSEPIPSPLSGAGEGVSPEAFLSNEIPDDVNLTTLGLQMADEGVLQLKDAGTLESRGGQGVDNWQRAKVKNLFEESDIKGKIDFVKSIPGIKHAYANPADPTKLVVVRQDAETGEFYKQLIDPTDNDILSGELLKEFLIDNVKDTVMGVIDVGTVIASLTSGGTLTAPAVATGQAAKQGLKFGMKKLFGMAAKEAAKGVAVDAAVQGGIIAADEDVDLGDFSLAATKESAIANAVGGTAGELVGTGIKTTAKGAAKTTELGGNLFKTGKSKVLEVANSDGIKSALDKFGGKLKTYYTDPVRVGRSFHFPASAFELNKNNTGKYFIRDGERIAFEGLAKDEAERIAREGTGLVVDRIGRPVPDGLLDNVGWIKRNTPEILAEVNNARTSFLPFGNPLRNSAKVITKTVDAKAREVADLLATSKATIPVADIFGTDGWIKYFDPKLDPTVIRLNQHERLTKPAKEVQTLMRELMVNLPSVQKQLKAQGIRANEYGNFLPRATKLGEDAFKRDPVSKVILKDANGNPIPTKPLKKGQVIKFDANGVPMMHVTDKVAEKELIKALEATSITAEEAFSLKTSLAGLVNFGFDEQGKPLVAKEFNSALLSASQMFKELLEYSLDGTPGGEKVKRLTEELHHLIPFRNAIDTAQAQGIVSKRLITSNIPSPLLSVPRFLASSLERIMTSDFVENSVLGKELVGLLENSVGEEAAAEFVEQTAKKSLSKTVLRPMFQPLAESMGRAGVRAGHDPNSPYPNGIPRNIEKIVADPSAAELEFTLRMETLAGPEMAQALTTSFVNAMKLAEAGAPQQLEKFLHSMSDQYESGLFIDGNGINGKITTSAQKQKFNKQIQDMVRDKKMSTVQAAKITQAVNATGRIPQEDIPSPTPSPSPISAPKRASSTIIKNISQPVDVIKRGRISENIDHKRQVQ